MSLFDASEAENRLKAQPLVARMWSLLAADRLGSVISCRLPLAGKIALAILIALPFVCLMANGSAWANDVPYGVGDWSETFGNHRARIRVDAKTDVAWVHIPWRRRDAKPEAKEIIVIDAATNKRVNDVLRAKIDRESGDLFFRPATAPGDYYVYYMPYQHTGLPYSPTVVYAAPTDNAAVAWKKTCEPLAKRILAGNTVGIVAARVLEIQAINDFHRFDPMEVVATAEEMQKLRAANAGRPYLLFPEDRRYPIRMTDELPLRWIKSGPRNRFEGEASRGDYYVFQVGVYAIGQDLKNVRVRFSPLSSAAGVISADAMQCFNAGGIDCFGRPFVRTIDVPKGRVQALWMGVQVPKDAMPGVYQGDVTVSADRVPDTTVRVSLTVADKLIEKAGDAELWRLSRLRWLNSTIGLDDEVFPPFVPVIVREQSQTIDILGRRVRIADGGLFDSIQSTFGASVDRADAPPREILAAPMRFIAEPSGSPLSWTWEKPKFTSKATGAVCWESTSRADGLELRCRAKMDCDGYVNYYWTLHATQPVDLKDIWLEIPMRREVAKYMMGLGRKGGYRPAAWRWKWNVKCANNQFWLGDVNAGLHCKLKHTEPRWDLYTLEESGTYRDWSNNGQGGCNVEESGDQVVARAYTGPCKLTAGQDLHFNFGLQITPIKMLDKQHWQWRYFHSEQVQTVEAMAAQGATLVNIHQGNALIPNINYPFLTADKLSAYIKQVHAKGIKVKLYYTVRELTNYIAEFWPVRSLGNEVFASGPGFRLADLFEDTQKRKAPPAATGGSWLCEHVITGYVPAWHTHLGNGHQDAAIATAGMTRWHNYYLEGLAWLLKDMDADGLYLDGIGYDREIMKRVRKTMQRTKPGGLIDLHSGNNFHPEYGLGNCANQYMEHLSCIDSLWFGEGFNYNERPDYWLVEIAGIPYGLFGEMLQDGGNPWRGMVYGMTNRLGWGGQPQGIWKLWDDFGIQNARMIGYWDPACPIKTGRNDVPATAYVRDGKTLVAIASWAPNGVKCKFQIDWKSLKLDPAKAKLSAGEIKGFQAKAEFRPTDEIPVSAGRGWLLLLHE